MNTASLQHSDLQDKNEILKKFQKALYMLSHLRIMAMQYGPYILNFHN